MFTTNDLLATQPGLSPARVRHLQRLIGEWQLVGDLSFADLLLWLPRAGVLVCVAQFRPTTAPTSEPADRVGSTTADAGLLQALRTGRIVRDPALRPPGAEGAGQVPERRPPLRREAVPVRLGDVVIAVMSRVTAATRSPSALEIAYVDSGDDLCEMIAAGRFPPPAAAVGDPVDAVDAERAARAGDGLVRLDAVGRVEYVSPNAWSVYRRMGVSGDLAGAGLAELTRGLVDDPPAGADVAARIEDALAGGAPLPIEVEARGAIVWLRALPLRPPDRRAGALLLLRDVTDVRRRDRQLSGKDASIREIHHRVKNNLQTVAALLRLQARRMTVPAARLALEESVRRVSSIALVHETLAISLDEWVDFDVIVDRLVPMVVDLAPPAVSVRVVREAAFGILAADVATPLVMVLTELLHNALEHAYAGRRASSDGLVRLVPDRDLHRLHVGVYDDGNGLPAGFSLEASDRLGLQIVRTLVESELQGTITLTNGPQGGTQALLMIPL